MSDKLIMRRSNISFLCECGARAKGLLQSSDGGLVIKSFKCPNCRQKYVITVRKELSDMDRRRELLIRQAAILRGLEALS